MHMAPAHMFGHWALVIAGHGAAFSGHLHAADIDGQAVAFSPDGKYVASGSFDKRLHVWDAKRGTLVRTHDGGGGIFEVCWNKDGSKLAACYSDNTVSVLDFRA